MKFVTAFYNFISFRFSAVGSGFGFLCARDREILRQSTSFAAQGECNSHDYPVVSKVGGGKYAVKTDRSDVTGAEGVWNTTLASVGCVLQTRMHHPCNHFLSRPGPYKVLQRGTAEK